MYEYNKTGQFREKNHEPRFFHNDLFNAMQNFDFKWKVLMNINPYIKI